MGATAKVNSASDDIAADVATVSSGNRYAVVGGGITGLATARQLTQLDPTAHVTVFESGARFGGVLQTEYDVGYVIENGADMFTSKPPTAVELWNELGGELGIDEPLLTTQPVKKRAYIGRSGKIVPVPDGFSMMVPSLDQPIHDFELMTETGKQRLFAEVDQPKGNGDDESLKSFAVRRFGQDAFDLLIQPLISGVYTADPARLSMLATMPRFVTMEQEHGSLIKASRESQKSGDQQASGARYGLFRAPARGMNSLVQRLVQSLGANPRVELQPNSRVKSMVPIDSQSSTRLERWNLSVRRNDRVERRGFSGVTLATPAAVASKLLADEPAMKVIADNLAKIETASSAIVVLGLDAWMLQKSFDGFGIIYPHIDQGDVIALSFSSNKFSGRAPEGKLLIRCFIGGAMQSELVDCDDDELLSIAIQQLGESVGWSNDLSPAEIRSRLDVSKIYRWRNCMPQYHLGHLEIVAAIESCVAQVRGLAIAGNSYCGVGIPACIDSGLAAAAKVVNDMA